MTTVSDILKEFVESTTKKIVDQPNEVAITSSVSTKAVIIQIKVAQSDCGKIIGRQGRTVDALKILCLAIKNTNFPEDSRKILLEVLEDENSNFKYNNNK